MKRILLLMLFPVFVSAQEPLSLNEARDMAIGHNRKIKQAALEREDTGLQLQSAYNQFLPSLGFDGGYQYRNKKYSLFEEDKFLPVVPYDGINAETGSFDPEMAPGAFAINPSTGQPVMNEEGNPVFNEYAWLPKSEGKVGQNNNFQFGFSIQQPIYMGGKIRSGYEIARLNEGIAEAREQLTFSEVIYQTDKLFWQVVTLEEMLLLSDSYIEMLDKLEADMENLFSEGMVTRNQVLQVKVKRNEVMLSKVRVENGLEMSRIALNQFLGLPLYQELQLDSDFSVSMLMMNEDEYVNHALENRDELQMLNQAVLIAEQLIDVKRADLLPSIGLMAGYNVTNPNPYNGFANEFGGDYTVGVGISIPIFHFGEKRNQVARSRIAMEKQELVRDEAREMVELEVNKELLAFHESKTKLDLADLSLEQAEENLKVTRNLFDEGRATLRDVLEAQAHWQDAFAASIQAKGEYRLAHSKLQKVLGTLDI